MPAEIRTLFEGFKAYKGGNNTLWALNELANTPKHKLLIPVVIGSGGLGINFLHVIKPGTGGVGIMAPRWDRDKNEIVFLRAPDDAEIQYNVNVAFSVALDHVDEVIRGQNPVAVLRAMAAEVESVFTATEEESRRSELCRVGASPGASPKQQVDKAMLIDSHCHLDFPDFAAELDAVVERARGVGIARLVTISTRVARHAAVLAIADRFADVYCSVGTHPHYAHEEPDVTAADLVARTRHPKVVAIGEAGLDYHYDNSPRDAQERGFRTHIAAARASGLPLVIHSRDADADTARILEEETGQGAFPAVLHCFTGGADLARRAVALGHFISFTGILTFKNSDALRAIAAALPADRILVETDAPYLAPGRFRGKRNEPAYVVETAKVSAEIRGVSLDEIARQTSENFFRLFGKVPRPAAARMSSIIRQSLMLPPHDAEVHHPRLRVIRRRPAAGAGLGRVRSEQSEEPPPAHVAARRASRQRRRAHAGPGRHVARPARATPRRRGRLARRRPLHPRACRPYPRHRRPALAVSASARLGRRLPRRTDRGDDAHAVRLLLQRRRPAASIRRWSASIA